MGFVKINQYIENWLNESDSDFDNLNDIEYRQILNTWRYNFEEVITGNNPKFQGEKAMSAIEKKLPCNVFIFNFTGSKLLPAATNTKDKTFGYRIRDITNLDRELLNFCDAIICSEFYDYTCIYTHEWQSLALPKYYLTDKTES